MKPIYRILSVTLITTSIPCLLVAGKKNKPRVVQNAEKNHVSEIAELPETPSAITPANTTIPTPYTYADAVQNVPDLSRTCILVRETKEENAELITKAKELTALNNEEQELNQKIAALQLRKEKTREEGKQTIASLESKQAKTLEKITAKETILSNLTLQKTSLAQQLAQAVISNNNASKETLEAAIASLNSEYVTVSDTLDELKSMHAKTQQRIAHLTKKPETPSANQISPENSQASTVHLVQEQPLQDVIEEPTLEIIPVIEQQVVPAPQENSWYNWTVSLIFGSK